MASLTPWQAWRLTVLATPEFPSCKSILQRSTRRQIPQRIRSRHHLPVRHVTYTVPRYTHTASDDQHNEERKDIRERKAELDQSAIQQYPRIDRSIQPSSSLKQFAQKYAYLEKDQVEVADGNVVVAGRISSVRKSGGKLAFVDITEEPDHQKLQIILNLGQLESVEKKDFAAHIRLIRRGDVISIKGFPSRSSSGQLSLKATELTSILSPCLHTIPVDGVQQDLASESELLDRHVTMLADPGVLQTLTTRAKLVKTMRQFFNDLGFHEVQTPILAASAGGATARPFETSATDFPEKKMSLRIAPELWLKRLVLGGMPRVYEIGPSFRNEGLDNTHNPEFTTCEFYAAYHTLPQLQRMTEQLLHDIADALRGSYHHGRLSATAIQGDGEGQFAEIDFIPAINSHLSQPLPNLTSPDARTQILELISAHSIPVPAMPTLPRLLDKLCSHFLEPMCNDATWIINTPECLSPLAKSFVHPTAPNEQVVAARAELFIQQKEVVNCYEEENSPFEQRRKFVEQQMFARTPQDSAQAANLNADLRDDEAMKVDEDYLRALEWGLPPTGGWGCGVDRLVMLYTGQQRIGDVLSFGNLRAVSRGAERYQKMGSKD